jgi:hypothetical protein
MWSLGRLGLRSSPDSGETGGGAGRGRVGMGPTFTYSSIPVVWMGQNSGRWGARWRQALAAAGIPTPARSAVVLDNKWAGKHLRGLGKLLQGLDGCGSEQEGSSPRWLQWRHAAALCTHAWGSVWPFLGSPSWLRRCAVNPTAWSQHGSGYDGVRSGWAARVSAVGQWRAASGARRFCLVRGCAACGDRVLGARTLVRALGEPTVAGVPRRPGPEGPTAGARVAWRANVVRQEL